MGQKAARQQSSAAVLLVLLCVAQQLLPSCCDEAAAPTAASSDSKGTKPLAQPDYSLYLRKTDLLRRVREVVSKHSDVMKYETRHAADGDYKADLMVVTVEPSGLRPTHKSKARLLLDFGEHGREFITSEVGLRLLEVLGDPQQLSKVVGGGKRAARLQAILQQCVFKVLPMENVAGRDLVEGGSLCERKNGRGVDPNRNWDIDWGVKEKDYDPKEEFPGRAPLSEPEVQVLLSLAKELKPHVWLNVHSGMFALFTPYDHKGHVPNTTDARAALRMMKRIQQLSCPQCKVGSGGHTVGYLAHGTATDYMFEVLKIPMSFTWEIYGDESASYDDCFRMFNPLGKEHFEEVASLWVKALLQLIELLPTHPATWPFFKKQGLDSWEDVAPAAQNATKEEQLGPAPAAAAAQQQQDDASKAGSAPGPSPEAEALLPSTPEETQQQATAAAAAAAPASTQVQPQPEQQSQPQEDSQQAPAATAAAGDASLAKPDSQQQPAKQQEQPPADSTDVSLEEHLGSPTSSSSTWFEKLLVFINKVLPWVLSILGFGLLLYCVTRSSSPSREPAYRRVPLAELAKVGRTR